MNIEIITTSNDTLKETGFGTFDSCTDVLNSIRKLNHNCQISSCNSEADLEAVLKRKPDLALLAVKYIPIKNRDDIWLSEYFEQHAIAYSGSTKNTLEFDSNKILAKRHLQNKGIATAAFFTASTDEFQRDEDLPINYPLFIKPNNAANSNGVDEDSYVSSIEAFQHKVSTLQQEYGAPILVEEYLSGKEYTVAILDTQNDGLLVSAVELVTPTSSSGHNILGKDIKSEDSEVLKHINDKKIKHLVTTLATDVFVSLGIEGFARIDIRSNGNGKHYFIEANLVPGMTYGSSYFPEAFRIDQDISYDQTISHIIGYALESRKSAMNFVKESHTLQRELPLNLSM